MNKNIKYEIAFHSYWHCGAGLAAGAGADMLVVKDSRGLPFVPGKTIKGLLREVMEETDTSADDIHRLFGETPSAGIDLPVVGQCFFSNACLEPSEADAIVSRGQQQLLFGRHTSTAIDEFTGTAKDFSLRTMEVTIPCRLIGYIYNVDDSMVADMSEMLSMIKRIGVNRNRGLGRCDIKVIEE